VRGVAIVVGSRSVVNSWTPLSKGLSHDYPWAERCGTSSSAAAFSRLIAIPDADLRFTPENAARYLNEAMGLSLAPEVAARLTEQMEGWVVGLQMAALALRGVADPSGFLAVGSHRYLVNDLFPKVMQRQPPEVQAFLARTAFLDRLCGPLCEAVSRLAGPG
jgi:LuxR family maltose regulon positive regulatory protein